MIFRSMVASGLVALLTAGVAAAATVTATFTGTVYNSFDATGYFGLGAGSGVLDGEEFTMTFIVDTSAGVTETVPGQYVEVHGGSVYGEASVASASLTVNGTTIEFDGSFESLEKACVVPGCADGSRDFLASEINDDGQSYDEGYLYGYVLSLFNDFPMDLEAIPDDSSIDYDNSYGAFGYATCLYGDLEECAIDVEVWGELHITGFTMEVAAVPLPAGFATLGGGLALLWALIRRRRQDAAAAA